MLIADCMPARTSTVATLTLRFSGCEAAFGARTAFIKPDDMLLMPCWTACFWEDIKKCRQACQDLSQAVRAQLLLAAVIACLQFRG